MVCYVEDKVEVYLLLLASHILHKGGKVIETLFISVLDFDFHVILVFLS